MFSISAAVASSFCVLQFAIFPAPTSVTGGAAAGTVIAELPLFPSLVAVIFAKPVATPVTSPLPFTVATPGASVDQVIALPESGLPLASSGVAVSCCVVPMNTEADAGLTLTDATGTGFTMIAALALFPSLVAVILAEPTPAPVTRPLAFTVATLAASVDQMIARPESGLPLASSGVAVSCSVPPTRIVALVGLKLTDATGTMTVIAALPLLPSLAAVMLAVPAASAVTSPLPFTVATPGASLDQVIVRPESGFPLASSSVAVSCCVAPAYIDAVAGLTLTEATGTGFTVMAAPALFPSLVAVMFAEPTATPGTSPFAFTGVAVSCWVPPTTIVAAVGLTVSDATGIVTVTAAVALLPSLVAVTFAEPAATAVTSPLASTVATPAASVDHVMTRLVRTLPSASWSVAVICCVAPTPTVAAVGLTLTDATVAGFTVIAALPPFPSLVAERAA